MSSEVSSFTLRAALLPSVIYSSLVNNSINTQAISNLGPATPSSNWYLMYKRWEPIIHLNGGTLVMREATTKYLPREAGESDVIYYNRLNRSVLYGAYSRTVKSLAALPFITPIQFKDLPSELEYLTQAADGTDQDIESLCQELTQDILDYGKCHILVDYPRVDIELRAADERVNNIRPYFVKVSPLNLIRWKTERIGSKEIVTEIAIYEDSVIQNPEDEFSEKILRQVRVISNSTIRIITLEDNKTRTKDSIGYTEESYPNTLGKVPLITIYGLKEGLMQSKPVLEELAWLNIRHWQKQSDLDNIEHVANVPFALATGVGEEEFGSLLLGSHTLVKMSSENANIRYVEHSGAAIGTSQNSMRMLEDRMIAMGADLLSAKASTRETAYSADINNTKSISVLEGLIRKLETGLKGAFGLAAEWLKLKNVNVTADIGESLNLSLDANEMTSLISMLEKGMLSSEDLGRELKRRGTLANSTSVKEPKKEEPLTVQSEDVNKITDTKSTVV